MTRRRSFDVVLAVALGAAGQAEAWLGPYDRRPLLSLVCFAMAAPLVWRRTAPMPANLAVVGAFATGQALTGALTEMASGTLPLLVAAYTAAAVLSLRRSAVVGAVTLAVALLSVLPDPSPSSFAYAALVVGIAWGVGRVVAGRHLQVGHLAQEADRLRQEQDLEARRAVGEERARIARELHDVVAHSVSVMVVQAGAADGAVRNHPEAAERALREVQRTGRQALVELRRMLDLLRDEASPDELAPQPGLLDVVGLVTSAREAGLDVTLQTGELAEVPPALALTAYRIVQESLTNALRYAGPAPVEVQLARSGDVLRVAVRDAGRGAAATTGTGHGLIGMRERVALFGGTLDIETSPGQGFAVTARLPVGRPA